MCMCREKNNLTTNYLIYYKMFALTKRSPTRTSNEKVNNATRMI